MGWSGRPWQDVAAHAEDLLVFRPHPPTRNVLGDNKPANPELTLMDGITEGPDGRPRSVEEITTHLSASPRKRPSARSRRDPWLRANCVLTHHSKQLVLDHNSILVDHVFFST